MMKQQTMLCTDSGGKGLVNTFSFQGEEERKTTGSPSSSRETGKGLSLRASLSPAQVIFKWQAKGLCGTWWVTFT